MEDFVFLDELTEYVKQNMGGNLIYDPNSGKRGGFSILYSDGLRGGTQWCYETPEQLANAIGFVRSKRNS